MSFPFTCFFISLTKVLHLELRNERPASLWIQILLFSATNDINQVLIVCYTSTCISSQFCHHYCQRNQLSHWEPGPYYSMNIASTAFSLSTPILTLKFCRCMMLALLCILLWPSCQLLPNFLTDFPRQTPRQHCRWLCLVKHEMSHSSSSGTLASTSDFCLLSIHRSCKILLCQPWKIMASVTSMTVAQCH